MNDDAKLM